MGIFDLAFLLSVLASAVTLAVITISVVRGRSATAVKLLKAYGLCVLAYLLSGVAVSYFKPQRVIPAGEPWCFDDWCLSVEKVTRTPKRLETAYSTELRIFSRARRISQRANGAWIYLIDERGRRYSPAPDPDAVPLNVLLQPGESVSTSRVFYVPNGARPIGLVTGHGGPYCGVMAFLVIGDSGCLFRKPTMIGIP